MNRLIAVVLIGVVALTMGFAQVTKEERAAKSDAIQKKIRQLDLYNHLLPILLSKEQMRKILPAIQKARQLVTLQEKQELTELMGAEAKIDRALLEAKKDGKVPESTFLGTMASMMSKFNFQRQQVVNINLGMVSSAFREVLTPTQMKIAMNSLRIEQYDPTFDPKKFEKKEDLESFKFDFFVRMILLDPAVYDVLVELSK